MGKPFCTCPEGLRGDPNVGCGKNVWDIINNTDSFISIRLLPSELILYCILQKNDSGFFYGRKPPMHLKSQTTHA